MTGKGWQTDAQIVEGDELLDWPGLKPYLDVQWEPRFARGLALEGERWRKLIFEAKANMLFKMPKYGANNRDLPLCEDFSECLDIEIRYLALKYGLEYRPLGGPCDLTRPDGNRHSIYWRFVSGGGMLFAEPQPSDDTFFDASGGVPPYIKTLDFMDW